MGREGGKEGGTGEGKERSVEEVEAEGGTKKAWEVLE